MKCPQCQHPESKVTDSRDSERGIRRRRECLACGFRFTTYEHQANALQVVKKDQRREEFSREKLAGGIRKACAKRPVSMEVIERAVSEIETRLQQLGRAEVPTSLIGEMVMERLKEIDPVAYIRFASVYREFADLGSFQQAVEALAQERLQPTGVAASGQLALLPIETSTSKRGRGRRQKRKARLAPLSLSRARLS